VPQLGIGALLLLELLQRTAQLLVALAAVGLVQPQAAHGAAVHDAQHVEVARAALPFEAVLAPQRGGLGQGGLLGRPQGGGRAAVEEVGVQTTGHVGHLVAQESAPSPRPPAGSGPW
jgi:hypothetical protein